MIFSLRIGMYENEGKIRNWESGYFKIINCFHSAHIDIDYMKIKSILIKFSVSLSFCLSFCVFHSGDFIFKAICKFFFHLLEQVLGSVLVKSEFKYLK